MKELRGSSGMGWNPETSICEASAAVWTPILIVSTRCNTLVLVLNSDLFQLPAGPPNIYQVAEGTISSV